MASLEPGTGPAHFRRRALLLSDGHDLTYRVMRCVAEAGFQTDVLGTLESTAARLARSRCCRKLEHVSLGEFTTGSAVARINALAAKHSLELVVATDAITTRFLARHGSALAVPHFPVPDAGVFERLVNKDSFAALCRELGLPHPRTVICDTSEEALAVFDANDSRPLIVKPTDSNGSDGVWKLAPHDPTSRELLRDVPYRPIVLQDFIEGDDLCVLLLCDQGRISASITYEIGATRFEILEDDEVLGMMKWIARVLHLHGAVGFDMRRDAQGRIWLIECNPRFTYGGSLLSTLTGYNFVEAFLSPGALPWRAPRAVLHRAKMLRPWTLMASDRRHANYLLADARWCLMLACSDFYKVKIRRGTMKTQAI